jgi:hypothetical protein
MLKNIFLQCLRAVVACRLAVGGIAQQNIKTVVGEPARLRGSEKKPTNEGGENERQ